MSSRSDALLDLAQAVLTAHNGLNPTETPQAAHEALTDAHGAIQRAAQAVRLADAAVAQARALADAGIAQEAQR